MPSILKLFRVDEMARSREAPTWAVLDWAARQPGTFTVKDLYRVYKDAGGTQGETSFHTTIGHLCAKPWKDDQEKYAISDKRPLVFAVRGRQGAGGAHQLKWGLDHPLREPPPEGANDPNDVDDEGSAAIGDALERLTVLMGKDKLKASIARWKKMPSIHQAVADIRGNVPMKGQMDAVHVASDFLINTGRADDSDVKDAEDEVEYVQGTGRMPDAPGASAQAPAGAPQAEPMTTTQSMDPEDDSRDVDLDDEPDVPSPPPHKPSSPTVRTPFAPKKKHKGWGK